MSALTCISCHVAFSTAALHRDHYKSDWHRYNLMRKVAELPLVTYETFLQRAAFYKEKLEPKKSEQEICYCETCGKYFNTENALSNHLKSKKHLEIKNQGKLKKAENPKIYHRKPNITPETQNEEVEEEEISGDDDDSDWESVADTENIYDGEPLEENQCLFCSKQSTTLEEHIQHMTAEHSFFIPDVDFLTDLPGLMNYLAEKVGAGRLCLWCSRPSSTKFHSVQAVQQHMLDKGHTKMIHEADTLLEYANYYDYSSSYPEEEEKDPDTEVDVTALDGDDWQLVLPSGATVGHRSLRQYFKQNIKPTRVDRPHGKAHHMITNLMSQYKSLGWTGTTSLAAVKNARDLRYMRQLQAKNHLRVGQKGNYQPHYREQNPK